MGQWESMKVLLAHRPFRRRLVSLLPTSSQQQLLPIPVQLSWNRQRSDWTRTRRFIGAASSWMGLRTQQVRHGRFECISLIRLFSSVALPEPETNGLDEASQNDHHSSREDVRREKERLRQKQRRAKRRAYERLNKGAEGEPRSMGQKQQQHSSSSSILFTDSVPPSDGQTMDHNHRLKARQRENALPSTTTASTNRHVSAVTDPAVSIILNELKRLTLPSSSPSHDSSDPESSPSLLPPLLPILQSDGTTPLSTVNRARRVVSQFVPMWLRREPTWKIAVLEKLNLPTHLDTTASGSASSRRGSSASLGSAASVLQGNFYPDSIPSFAEILKQGPPESLYHALDFLVDAGLADPGTAEQYRTTNRMRVQHKDLRAAIADKKLNLERHQRLYDQLVVDLADVDARIDALSQSSYKVDSENQAPLDELVANQNEAFQKQMANLIKIKREKTRNMSRHRFNLDTVSEKIQLLQSEQAEPPLSDDEYSRIQKAASSAMPDITKAFADHVRDRNSQMLEQYQTLDSKTDLTRPHDWFLHARLDRRKIIFHGGPTNSGKTYAALERLKQAKKGMYLGPLRLLAVEIYEKLTADGIYCNLYTGQERREIPFATHGAATVEMAVMNEEYDVIVIDEIQMLSDWERGFAWSRALLGSRCKEIHVCGGLEAAKIVRRIVDACGDEFELKTYARFSELQIANDSLAAAPDQLGSFKHVRPGDCVVAFSRNDIFAIKREIESTTDYKCCVIYGTLPPATRSEQARRFNDPNSGYDVLVASDAIGMGLNLNIRRIIFNSVYKNDGTGIVRLDHSAMKQISGRAGRRNSPFPVGEVTTRDPRDIEYLQQCLQTDIQPIEKAGLLPTTAHIQTFSDTLEQYGLGHGPKNLHNVLLQFNDMASVKSDYFVCKQGAMVKIARVIARLDLSIPDKYLLCQCPVAERDSSSMDVLRRFAAKLAAGQVAGLTHSMIPRPPKSFDDLARLCSLFSELELFMWLNTKFPPGNVMEQQTAQSLKEQAIKMITQGLSMTDKLKLNHCYITRDRSLRQKWNSSQSKQSDRFDDDEDDDWNDGIQDV